MIKKPNRRQEFFASQMKYCGRWYLGKVSVTIRQSALLLPSRYSTTTTIQLLPQYCWRWYLGKRHYIVSTPKYCWRWYLGQRHQVVSTTTTTQTLPKYCWRWYLGKRHYPFGFKRRPNGAKATFSLISFHTFSLFQCLSPFSPHLQYYLSGLQSAKRHYLFY